ncbi:hypothetical protein MMC16_007818 [Acarospora aff. strigata]|nr:hypothetical protein [Acarospora aff. strigata]
MTPSYLPPSPLILLVLVFLFSPLTHSQTPSLLNFAPGALPACANTCTALYNAQNACIPPAAPVTNQPIYQSCFCQSGYLAGLYGSPDGVCDQACTGADRTQIQNWYKGLCGQRAGGAAAGGSSTSTRASASATTRAGTGVAGARSPSTPSGASNQSNGGGSPGQGWYVLAPGLIVWGLTFFYMAPADIVCIYRFSTHWKWVVMVIVLFLGLALLALASALLRRRYKRKREARMTMNTSAAVEAWYPQPRSVHDFGTGEQGGNGEKGKGIVRDRAVEREELGSEEKGGRLKKAFMRSGH